MFQRILNCMVLVGIRHPYRVGLLLLAITLFSAVGMQQLRIDTSFDNLIAGSDSERAAYEQAKQTFGSDHRTIVYVRDAKLWQPAKLAQLESLHHALAGLDVVSRVDDLFTLQSVRERDGSMVTRLLMPEAPKEQEEADAIREDALSNPLIQKNFISDDGQAVAIVLTLSNKHEIADFNQHAYRALQQVLSAYQGRFGQLFQLGAPRIHAEMNRLLLHDMVLLGPLSVLVLLITMLLFLRHWMAALLPLLTSLLALVWAFGLMGWLGIPINILTAMLPSLIVVIGSTEDTHLIANYFHAIDECGGDREAAATLTMRLMGLPLLLTILTTAFGFASNMFSALGLIQDFAVAATIAILANGVITVVLVPMLLRYCGAHCSPLKSRAWQQSVTARCVQRLSQLSHRQQNGLLLLTFLVSLIFVYQAAKLHVSNDPLSYFHDDMPLIQDAHTLHRDLAGMKVFFITLEMDDEDAFKQPRNLRKLVAIQDFLRKQGVYDNSISLADFVELLNQEFHHGSPSYHELPRQRETVAQYLLLLHRSVVSSYVSHDYRRANIVVRHNISDSALLNRNIRELKTAVQDIAGSRARVAVTGENLMINAATDNLMVAQVKSLLVLVVVIFLLMSLLFTSFKGGLVSLLPTLLPIVMMFGLMGWCGIALNPGTAMVAVIAIGIAIDGSIHLFSRYNDCSRQCGDAPTAVRETVRQEAMPMITTAIALALGFAILLFSDFALIAQFGALSAATMLFALYANLLVTPMVMARVRLVGLYQILSMTLTRDAVKNSLLFNGMSDYQVRKAILISEARSYDAGELLVEQGSVGRKMFLILSGEVEVVRRVHGEQKHLVNLAPGEVFGEIGYVREVKRSADIRALTPVEVICFDRQRMRADLKFFPHIVAKLNFNISLILGAHLEEIQTRLEGQLSEREAGGS